MRKKFLSFALGAVFVALSLSVAAQQTKKVPRIGYVSASSSAEASHRAAAFRRGLRDLGYVDGKNVVVEFRYAEGNFNRLPTLAAELVHLEVDVIATAGNVVTRAVKEATSAIPIVAICVVSRQSAVSEFLELVDEIGVRAKVFLSFRYLIK